MLLLHIGASHLNTEESQTSNLPIASWKYLTPPTRVFCVFLTVFAIALTPNGHWWTWLFYGVWLSAVVPLSRVKLLKLLQRLAIESSFIGVVLLGTLFQKGGEVVWAWGWLQITTQGLTILGSVALKAFLSLLVLNILTMTTSVPMLLHALRVLRVPSLLVAILASMHRYLSVLIEEFNAMRRAAASRNFASHKLWRGNAQQRAWQRQVIGNMIGVMFVRTYDRGERIYQAMLSRGLREIPPIEEVQAPGLQDLLTVIGTVTIALIGQLIYVG
ncbi:cobalt ECF transporter T component CbiQ [Tumidithrix helvetica PCC 7403]|uniref:cobalt ECF transporter T component CbiQ n=1 Tax=Tumidithrix helvetica TaxID=3457545 RepID=UPI003C9A5034